jgi:SAM-dependent methyltransferase
MNHLPPPREDWASRWFPGLFSYTNPHSFVNKLRGRRMNQLQELLKSFPPGHGVVRVLDIGGTAGFWKNIGGLPPETHSVMLLNLTKEPLDGSMPNFESMAGSALALPFPDQSFDVVFSNSVIEHVGSRDHQRQMANEILRVGKRHIIQTPSYWFPLEPHARLPFFQFLPRSVRAWLIYHFTINYFPSAPTYRECLTVSDCTILLTHKNIRDLFPTSTIITERLLGLPKSYVAVGGWTSSS